MKYLFVLLLALVSFTTQAQGFSLASTSTSTTVGSIEIAGKKFDGGLSSTGSTYIMRTAKTSGKIYKSYIGTDTGKKYDNKAVYTANVKSIARYFFFSIGSTGYPKRNYLTMD